MDPATLAAAVGSALVAAITTDAWETVRSTIVQLWRHVHPERAETVAAELAETREDAITARRDGDREVEVALAADWERRLRRLLRDAPNSEVGLQQMLDEVLVPALDPADRQRVFSIVTKTQTISARDNSMVFAVMDGTMNVHNTPPVQSKSTAGDSSPSSPAGDWDEN
jgi:hypothetical protein